MPVGGQHILAYLLYLLPLPHSINNECDLIDAMDVTKWLNILYTGVVEYTCQEL